MNIEALKEYCRSIHELFLIPLMIYRKEDGKIEASFFSDGSFTEEFMNDPRITERYMNAARIDEKHPVSYYISDDKIAFASVADIHSRYALYLGPCLLADPSEQMMHTMLTRSNSPFRNDPERYYDRIYTYILSLPRFTPERFLWLLSFANNCINQQVLPEEDFIQTSITKNRLDLKRKSIDSFEDDEDRFRRISTDLFAQIRILICNGSTDKTLEFWDLSSPDYFSAVSRLSSGYDRLRFEKNIFIRFITSLADLIRPYGVSEKQAYRLSSDLIDKAETCIISQQIQALYRRALIRFSEAVRNVKVGANSDNLLLKKAILYIHDHIEAPLSASQIAGELGVSDSHLSRVFNRNMSMKISDYINRQKIAIAGSLLTDTDYAIVEIADHLSFSSQSHFQNVFKKYTGTTPLRYRKNRH